MKTSSKKSIAILGLIAITMLPALTSCDKQEVEPANITTDPVSQNESALTSTQVVENKSVLLKPDELTQIRNAFKGINPSLYSLEIREGDKPTARLGSAAIADLQKVGTYYSNEYSSAKKTKVTRIVTRIITKIVIKKFMEDEKNLAQLAKVETILNTAAAR